jgi:hypothetical protein
MTRFARRLAGLTLPLALIACSAPDAPPEDADTLPADTAPAADETSDETSEDAAAALPTGDIYIAPLSWVGDIPALGPVRNATTRAGYDNQPAFTADGRAFYFSSMAGEQTDIWRCSLDCATREQITDTPDSSEYSPRPTPAGEALSYIYQPPGGYGGEVWLDSLDGGNARSASSIGPNGYYAFNADMTRLGVFALTEQFHLQVFGRFEDDGVISVAEGIGRALYASPDHQRIYFTLPRENGGFTVHATDFAGSAPVALFDLPGETQDYAVFLLPSGEEGFFAVDEGVLLLRDRVRPWQSIADLEQEGLTNVTRMAVSPDLAHIAIVADDPAGP